MDVSPASPHPEPHSNPSSSSPNPHHPLPPARPRAAPWRHGVTMGLAAGLSTAMICAVILAVGDFFGSTPLNVATVAISLIVAFYVGARSWRKQRAPMPASRGQCPDCGRDLRWEDKRCGLCGRPVSE